jgi:glycosyltransferase involved in cell wall biosynthesis
MSLIIPCYNEADNIPNLVARIVETMADVDAEIILVDNGSTDDTAASLRREIGAHAKIRSVRVDVNRGYGFGILAGLEAAKGEILAWTHADLQADPKDTLDCLALFDESDQMEALFCKGARHGRLLRDVAFTWGMAVFEWILLGVRMSDINAQPTMFHRRFYETWDDPPHDFSLDLYAYYMAVRAGLQVKRLPVYFYPRMAGVGHNETMGAKFRYSKRTIDYSVGLRRKLVS